MHDIVGITRCNQNVTTATSRNQSQKIELRVIGIIDNQKPRLIPIAKPVLSGFEGVVLMSNTAEPCVTGLGILFRACVNPEDTPEPIRACQLHISDRIEEKDWQREKLRPDVLVSTILSKFEAEL
jgi:hypothetical protein